MLILYPIGPMYAVYGNIYHQYTPNVGIQEVDNVIPPRPFCAFPNVNATFRKSSLSRPFGALPNVNATNT